MNTTWKYNGQSFELDLNDLNTLERYDAASDAMKNVFRGVPSGASDARQLITYCAGIRALVDTLFGEGTAAMLLGDSQKPTDYDDLLESFGDFCRAQTEENAKRREVLLDKYKPNPNREQRRAIEQVMQKITKAAEKAAEKK